MSFYKMITQATRAVHLLVIILLGLLEFAKNGTKPLYMLTALMINLR